MYDDIERVVDAVFFTSDIEPKARLTREPATAIHGPVLTVSSADGQSAEIQIHVESDRQLDLRLGHAARLELYSRSPDRLLADFRKLIEAVALQGMHEVVRTDVNGVIVSSRAQLAVDGKTKTYRWRGGIFGRGVAASAHDHLPYVRLVVRRRPT